MTASTKPAAKPAAKKAAAAPASKTAAKAAAEPVAKKAAAPAPVAKKVAAKAPTKPAAKPVAKPVKKAAAKVAAPKPVKVKLVRDSFTVPSDEYAALAVLKQKAIALQRPAKKSELLRAGIKLLASLGDAALLKALNDVPAIKTGRPKTKKGD